MFVYSGVCLFIHYDLLSATILVTLAGKVVQAEWKRWFEED